MIIDEDVQTADIGEAATLIGRVYGRSRVVEGEQPFLFRQAVRGDERLNFAEYRISSKLDLAVELDDVLCIGRRSAGHYEASSNGQRVDPSGYFLLRPGEAQSVSVGLRMTTINLHGDALAEFISGEKRAGSRLRLDQLAPVSPARAALLEETARYVQVAFTDRDALHNELIRHSAVDLLLASAAATFGITVEGDDSSLGAGPATLRRAVSFIQDNAHLPIGVLEIAAAARLTPRGIQNLFHRELGVTPTGYLRRVRLDGAHAYLLAADPTTASVAEIAKAWGFTHPARFAAYYRAEYGVNPHVTLRR